MIIYRKTFLITLLVAVICVPIVVNIICLTVFPAPIIGNGEKWLGFWGSYLGGVTTVLATIFVLDRNHNREINRKEYEIQKNYFDSLCIDMGKLCSSIDTDTLSFYLMNLRSIVDAVSIFQIISNLESKMNCEYNEFCLKYAHNKMQEKDNLINTYYDYADSISKQISLLQEAIVDRQVGTITENVYNSIISRVCKELENLGDIRTQLFLLANNWKKKEWMILEDYRNKYVNE